MNFLRKKINKLVLFLLSSFVLGQNALSQEIGESFYGVMVVEDQEVVATKPSIIKVAIIAGAVFVIGIIAFIFKRVKRNKNVKKDI